MEVGAYYLHAAVDHLRENNPFFDSADAAAHNIRVMPDERPFPGASWLFIGLRIGEQSSGVTVIPGLDYKCELVVSVTLRTTTAQYIDLGEEFYVRRDGRVNFQASLHHICARIVSLIHNSNDYLQRVQNLICANEGTPNIEYPATGVMRYKKSLPQPRIVDYTHFTENSESSNSRSDAGLLDILTFGDGERLS